MPPNMKPEEWVGFITREYLASFVKDGGAAIKVAVVLDEEVRPYLKDDLERRSQQEGFLVASVNAADTRVHMIDQIFFRVAEQIPWQRLSEQVIIRLAREEGYVPPADGDTALLIRMAEANQTGSDFLKNELRRHIERRVFRQRKMSKDFRVAMTQLCLAELTGGPEGDTTVKVLTDWLTGRNTAVSAVKPYQIFGRISRNNARYFIESLLRWTRFAGHSGIVVLLDTARVTVARNPRDGLRYYTKAQVLDAYEVLRQFIDGTDRLKGCLVVVVPDVDFLDDDSGRGIGAYEALKFRVFDEVRDSRLVNPMASLVRLAPLPAEGRP